MSTVDIDALLLEIDPANPCGPNLEREQAFQALDREVQGKPEVQYGATIVPAVPPDWKTVRRMAADLLAHSRDLRLAVHLLRAELALHGISGLADGVVLIQRMLDTFWDGVYPSLDTEEDDDPTERINCLAILCDPATLLREVKDATLVVLPRLGPLTIRLIDIANGDLPPPAGQEKIEIASIESAIADLDAAALAGAVDALGRALAAVVKIEETLAQRVGNARALNLDVLTRPLRKAHEFLVRLQQDADPGAGVDVAVAQSAASTLAPAPAAALPAVGDVIAGRDDVVRALDRLIQYYRRQEPSSPVPILLERAKRLVPMNFLELLQDLAPEGVAQLAVIRGPEETKQADDH